ncbi:hypothetical protein OSB04_020150 [Centaurea solstitialis]|uniref:Uncharacterized protein n=1 Tax=Centaurea solstitialis TaxID=347529 RepID=A0AA38W5M4_9ASTR|nr:hypothetical protein OSB04_020150 [Centaurea solstitialis]
MEGGAKTMKNNRTLCIDEYHDFKAKDGELLKDTYTSLGNEWLHLTMSMRATLDLETTSLADLYGTLAAQESIVLQMRRSIGGPLALVAEGSSVKGKEKEERKEERKKKKVLEAIERKSTKSCGKMGKSEKSGIEVLRVREVIILVPRMEIIETFYAGLNNESRLRLDSYSGGIFAYKTEKEARKLLDDLEAHHLDWSTDEEETKPVQLSEVTPTQEELRYKCERCGYAHPTKLCTWQQAPHIPRLIPQEELIEMMLSQFMIGQGTVSTNIYQQIQIFASHIACLHKGLGHILRAVKETYPHVHTDTEDPAEVFITTRGGKVVEGPSMPEANQIPNFQVVEPEAELPSNQTEGGKQEVVRPKESVPIPNPARVPYPARLRKEKKEAQYRKFIDLIKQVNIYVPLVDLIAGMPNYMKFIKELVSNKENLGVRRDRISECRIALVELGASINLMPLSFYQKLGLGYLKDTRMTIQLADRSTKYPVGIAKDVLVQVDKFFFPADFVILDIKDEVKVPLILGRPFLNTAQAVINVAERQLSLGIGEDRITFSIDQGMSYAISTDDRDYEDNFNQSLEMELNNHLYETRKVEHENMEIPQVEGEDKFEEIKQEDKQGRLNPKMQEVVKKEVIKLLDTGIIYPISDSPWVSPVYVVPKKGGLTVVTSDNNELVPTRTVTGWRVYRLELLDEEFSF